MVQKRVQDEFLSFPTALNDAKEAAVVKFLQLWIAALHYWKTFGGPAQSSSGILVCLIHPVRDIALKKIRGLFCRTLQENREVGRPHPCSGNSPIPSLFCCLRERAD